MRIAAALPMFLTRLRDWSLAKADLWVAGPTERYLLSNVRLGGEGLKAILMGARNASLLLDGEPAPVVFHRCRSEVGDQTDFLRKLVTRCPRPENEVDVILLLEGDSTPDSYVAVTRLFHRRINLHVFRDEPHLKAALPAIAGGSQLAQLQSEVSPRRGQGDAAVVGGPLIFDGEISAPAVYANAAREHLKTVAPFARYCALWLDADWGCDRIIALCEGLAEALPGWGIVVFHAVTPVPRALAERGLFLPQARGFLHLGQFAFLLEADAFVGSRGLLRDLAQLAGKPCHSLDAPCGDADTMMETACAAAATITAGDDRRKVHA